MDQIFLFYINTTLQQSCGFSMFAPVFLLTFLGAFNKNLCIGQLTLPNPVVVPSGLEFLFSWTSVLIIGILLLLDIASGKIPKIGGIKTFFETFLKVPISNYITFVCNVSPLLEAPTLSGSPVIESLNFSSFAFLSFANLSSLPFPKIALIVFLFLYGLFVMMSFSFIKMSLQFIIDVMPDIGILNTITSFMFDSIGILSCILAIVFPVIAFIFTIFFLLLSFIIVKILKSKAEKADLSILEKGSYEFGVL